MAVGLIGYGAWGRQHASAIAAAPSARLAAIATSGTEAAVDWPEARIFADWRAMLACCLPLTLATFLGYWFMKELDIGLTVATLPVMVLAVGIGVDYAFYIYNRLQLHLALGVDIVNAFKQALRETGIATIFTALTLSVGVATWSFSDLKFQADMGLLLTFMFMVNMLMAITLLPALAVMIDKLIPRRRPVRAPLLSH